LTESFPKGYREKDPNNWIDTLQRKFDNLKLGQLGQIFKRAEEKKRKDPEWTFAKEYLTTPTIIELNTIPDREQQALLMAFILTFIFETRQTEGVVKDNNEKLPRHVLVIEEAHRLLGRNTGNRHSEISGESASGKAATMFSDMLAEVRAFGQSVFIAEQIPSKIIPDAVKNTNLKFLMRLTSAEDRRFMGEAMNCSELQQQFVNTLKAGQAVVFEEGLNQPILLTIPNIFTK
jgi:hypothetical protein